MEFDIRTVFLTGTIIIIINTVILLLAWYYSKPARSLIKYFSFSLLMGATGTVLIALRGSINDFLSIVLCNISFAACFVALQEGICHYTGQKNPLRPAMYSIFLLQGILILCFTYLFPSFFYRVIVFCLTSIVYCSLSIYTILNSRPKNSPPLHLLLGILALYLILSLLRLLRLNKATEIFLQADFLATIILIGYIAIASALSLCYLWLITHHLGLELQKQACFDPLTQVQNRRLMDRLLTQEEFSSWPNCAVVWLDVDYFKTINDTHGHQAGDAYLIKLSHFLSSHLQDCGQLFRYGGDEFIIVFLTANQEQLLEKIRQLREKATALTVMWNDAPITATLSAGIAFHSEATSDWNDLLRQADQALYEAKKSGRNQLFTAGGKST